MIWLHASCLAQYVNNILLILLILRIWLHRNKRSIEAAWEKEKIKGFQYFGILDWIYMTLDEEGQNFYAKSSKEN